MKFSVNEAKLSAIILSILMVTSIAMITTSSQPVQGALAASQPVAGPLPAGVSVNFTTDSDAFLSFTPTTVGVNQLMLVNMWVNPALSSNNRYFPNAFVITLTKPDGTKDVIKIDSEAATGAAWFNYVPDQVGNWTIKFDFLGCYFPAGNYYNGYVVTNTSGTAYGSCYYRPSSTGEQALTVQQAYVPSWPGSPLPTDYWTRPTAPENREWWSILGNYPGTGYQGQFPSISTFNQLYPGTNPYWSSKYLFTPWVQGPNSAHIVWKQQNGIAGIIGGPAGSQSLTANPGDPDVVYAGRCYQTVTKANGTSYAQCYDLRTGDIYYEIQGGVTPQYITYISPAHSTTGSPEEIGTALANTGWSVELLRISGSNLLKINPWTGAVSGNYSIAPLSGGTFYNQIDGYVLNVQGLGASAGAQRYRLINWTTRGTSTTLAARIISNTTYLLSSLPADCDFADDRGTNSGTGFETYPYGLSARWGGVILIYRLSTGELLFNITTDWPDTTYQSGTILSDHGKVAMWTQHGYYIAFDLFTGKLAWRSERGDYPLGATGFGAYSVSSAYGMLFKACYDGVYAFNWTNGKIVWHYQAPSLANFESPYINNGTGQYPFNSAIYIADGKVYSTNSEHTESQPLTRGWGVHCINATTGEGIWHVSLPGETGAIADGYATVANARDGYMYVFGKGLSATTVTAPDIVISQGSGVVIKGTVLDQSPAKPGTPCVSKDSMQTQMEYLHKGMPIGGIWGNETITGVPVTLQAIDASNNVIDIGKTTTNGYYGTFTLAWTPPKEGTYQIIASFVGDESYSSSAASTGIVIGPAPTATPTVAPTATPASNLATTTDLMTYIVAVGIAIIIAIAIVGILILRKH